MAMNLQANLQLKQELRLKLAPQVIQSIEILQLPLLELQDRIEQELLDNPVLERAEENPPEETPGEEAGQAAAESAVEDLDALQPATAEGEGEEFTRLDDLYDRWEEDRYVRSGRYSPEDKDRKQEALDATPAPPVTLQEHLSRQLAFFELADGVRRAAEALVANLDWRGYLDTPLEEVVQAMDEPVNPEEAEAALDVVQSLEPVGVGARDLSECLLLQLDEEDPDYPFARELLSGHFEDILKNRYPLVSRRTGRSIDEIKRVVERIAQLNPLPGALFHEEPAPHVSPDIRVELIDGQYEVILEDAELPRVSLSRYYIERLSQPDLDDQTRAYIQKRIESARWLLEAIEQRRTTLQRVTNKIVEVQKDFLEHGVSRLHPLKMQEIADALGIHVSTVSRAIAKKYIQTPQGIYPMKHFFTGGVETASGRLESWDAIRQKMQEIIDAEDKQNPLSDEEIVEAFRKQGIEIARRTVTKYRKQMSIPSSRGRKQY
jgi:RNA polymerase sigma-54 factor